MNTLLTSQFGTFCCDTSQDLANVELNRAIFDSRDLERLVDGNLLITTSGRIYENKKLLDNRDPQNLVENNLSLDKLAELVKRYNRGFEQVRNNLIGYDTVTDQARLTLACGRHMMLVGSTGQAKSMFAREVARLFSDCKLFTIQLTKGTPEEALFGALDPTLLRRGIIAHNPVGTLLESDIAFLDEFPDASMWVQRSVLNVLNEGRFEKGSQVLEVPLHTAIATGNFKRDSDVLEAVQDRFLTWAALNPSFDAARQDLIADQYLHQHDTNIHPLDASISRLELAALARISRGRHPEIKVDVPDHCIFYANRVIQEFASAETLPLPLSPRRANWIYDIARASALLENRFVTNLSDVTIALDYCLIPSGDKHELHKQIEKLAYENQCLENSQNQAQIHYLFAIRREIRNLVHGIRDSDGISCPVGLINQLVYTLGLRNVKEAPFSSIKQQLKINQQGTVHKSVVDLKDCVARELQEAVGRIPDGTVVTTIS